MWAFLLTINDKIWYKYGQGEVMSRNKVESSIIELLKSKEWLHTKLVTEQYSCSRLAKELGTTRTTVEKYRVLHQIEQPLSQKQLTTINYQNKQQQDKQTILERRKQTNIKLYGTENTFQSHRDKIVDVMQEKYGVKSPLQSPDIFAKQQATMVERYGVTSAVHSAVLYQKQIDTNRRLYGDNPAKLGKFQEKTKHTNLNKYGVDYHTQKHLSREVLDNLSNRDWLIEHHHTLKKTLSQVANEVGCNITTVYRYCMINNVEIKHYYESAQQREISDWLQTLNITVDINRRDLISGELDIYLPEHDLAIEYCGVYWHSDIHPRITSNYHLNKLKLCQTKNIRLLTIFEDEWVYRKEIVKQKILAILGKTTSSVFARKCDITKITNKKIKQQFFNQHHIQGSGPGSITYGLMHNNVIVAMMTFIEQVDGVYVLNRYASSPRVVGGFQKLLAHFCKSHVWKQLVSFADLRWSEGDVYNKGGFALDKILQPDYRYVFGNNTHHKFAFRRERLKIFLGQHFNPSLTEVENMRNAGYYRIWNCGLLRYVLVCK